MGSHRLELLSEGERGRLAHEAVKLGIASSKLLALLHQGHEAQAFKICHEAQRCGGYAAKLVHGTVMKIDSMHKLK
jgi:hypothetical protein